MVGAGAGTQTVSQEASAAVGKCRAEEVLLRDHGLIVWKACVLLSGCAYHLERSAERAYRLAWSAAQMLFSWCARYLAGVRVAIKPGVRRVCVCGGKRVGYISVLGIDISISRSSYLPSRR